MKITHLTQHTHSRRGKIIFHNLTKPHWEHLVITQEKTVNDSNFITIFEIIGELDNIWQFEMNLL